MKLQSKVLAAVAILGVGFAFGRFFAPEKVITKVETKVEVQKEIVEVEVEKVKTEYRTIVKEITKPDGTTIKETVKEEIKDESTVVKAETKEETKVEKKSTKIVINKKPQWRVQALYDINPVSDEPRYGVGVERRIFGPFFAGVQSKGFAKEIMVTISMEF